MPRSLLIILLSLFIRFNCGAISIVDSLKNVIKECQNDSCLISNKLLLCEQLLSVDIGQADQVLGELTSVIKEQDEKNYFQLKYLTAHLLFSKNRHNHAFTLLTDIRSHAIETKNKLAEAYSDLGFGKYYLFQNDLKKAIDLSFHALQIFEEINLKKGVAASYYQISNINYQLKNNSKAIEFANKCISLSLKEGFMQSLSNSYNCLGNIYSNGTNDDIALEYYQRALKINKENGYLIETPSVLMNIGTIYSEKNKLVLAEKYYKEALEQNTLAGNKKGASMCYINIGNVNFNSGNYKAADKNYTEALKYLSDNDLLIKENIYYNLGEVNYKLGNKDKAFAYQDSCMSAKDSLYNRESIKSLNEMQTMYESEQKERENVMLRKQQETERAMTTEKEKKQNVITYSITLGLIIVLAFSFFISNRLKVARQQKRIIESQKQIVDEKQKEILDSIHYAQRIQNAILAKEEDIKINFPESFLFYKPKDIVAGDFYFYESTATHVFYAAADCTGHGVPGALVSIVCSNALSRCVLEFDLNDPGKILDKARELVLETFKKSGQDVKDGMDISFLVKEKKTGKIKWAGANNPLWKLNSNSGQMEEIKANKQPIGLSDDPKPFTTHEIKMDKNDSLYLFTDGLPDQFGGPKGKKYKYKRLQEQLIACSGNTTKLQKEHIQNDLRNWMGSNEQVDDILLIGIKF